MQEKISTLMDGELCMEETDALLAKIRNHAELRQEWAVYHLVGDALRQPEYTGCDISDAIIKRLREEPTILAPHARRVTRAGYFAMSAVASIMAVAFIAWLSIQMNAAPVHQMARQSSGNVQPALAATAESVNDYLLAHQEFSPVSDVRGAASFVRTVAYEQSAAGK